MATLPPRSRWFDRRAIAEYLRGELGYQWAVDSNNIWALIPPDSDDLVVLPTALEEYPERLVRNLLRREDPSKVARMLDALS